MKKVLLVGLLVLGLATLPIGRAEAANLNVDVDIVWPSILILYCYSDVDITVTSAVLGQLMTGVASGDQGVAVAGPGAANATVVGSTLVADVLLGTPDTDLLVSEANIPLIIDNVCAIRAIGTNGGTGVQVGVAYTANTTLDSAGAGTGTIDLAGAPAVRVDAGAFGSPVTFAPGGLGTLHNVDVQVNLDASNADEADTYSSAAAGNFTVTATLI
jgi:hypothetical protein